MIDYNVLKQIRDNVNDKETVLSIIQSLSFNQERCKDWLIEKSEPYLQALDDPKICSLPFCGASGDEYSTPKLGGSFKIITLDKPVNNAP